jgi:hypothetical protein
MGGHPFFTARSRSEVTLHRSGYLLLAGAAPASRDQAKDSRRLGPQAFGSHSIRQFDFRRFHRFGTGALSDAYADRKGEAAEVKLEK